jgi:hypothetical protein
MPGTLGDADERMIGRWFAAVTAWHSPSARTREPISYRKQQRHHKDFTRPLFTLVPRALLYSSSLGQNPVRTTQVAQCAARNASLDAPGCEKMRTRPGMLAATTDRYPDGADAAKQT